MLASERICSRSWNECLCIVLRFQKQTQWSTWAAPAADPWTPGPAGSPFQLPPVLCGSHPPANLMSASPAGLGPPAGELFGDRALRRQQSRRAGLDGGQGGARAGPLLRDGRERCTDLFIHLARLRGREGSRTRVGSRSIAPTEPLGLGIGSGSLGRRPLPWEVPSSGCPSGPRGPAMRAGPAGDLLSRGEMRPQSGATLLGRPRCPAPRRKERARAEGTQPHKALQWRPGAGPRPAGTTPARGEGFAAP